MRRFHIISLCIMLSLGGTSPFAAYAAEDEENAAKYLNQAYDFYRVGQYFKSARYAFGAAERDPELAPEAYSWITLGLAGANLYNSASYFFIKTLQSGDKKAIRRVLTKTQDILMSVGPDLLRKYLIRHTSFDDYDGNNKSAYLFALAKEALLVRDFEKAIGYVNAISTQSAVWPYGLMLRGTAHAFLGKGDYAVHDFESCADRSKDILRGVASTS
ncbi:MAG: hypothetical protein AABZ55_09190, partial [Bdellovibrionota bacterium]